MKLLGTGSVRPAGAVCSAAYHPPGRCRGFPRRDLRRFLLAADSIRRKSRAAWRVLCGEFPRWRHL